jgi:DNA-binding GntR family transcriptional regulator
MFGVDMNQLPNTVFCMRKKADHQISTETVREAQPLVRRDSLSEGIYLALRARLQRLEAGQETRLVDVDIATEYGTSRMPAREALLRLVNEGYLVGTTRGFVLPRLGLDDIREIFEVRRLLEPAAAAAAARDLGVADEARLTEAIEAARAACMRDDVERLILANMAFRVAWLGAVRNRRLAGTIRRFVDQVQIVRLNTLIDQPTRLMVIEGLEKLYRAFRGRDGQAAAQHMQAFIEAAETAFFSVRQAEIAREQVSAMPPRPTGGLSRVA